MDVVVSFKVYDFCIQYNVIDCKTVICHCLFVHCFRKTKKYL